MALMFLAVAIRIRGYLRGTLGHDEAGTDAPPAGETADDQQYGGPNRADDR
jgi:hypothetical protein